MRYGADYRNAGYEAENECKSAPNAPYALFLPTLLPTPYSLLPIP
ncbi:MULTISPECIES: hypothetical protein [unclassified Moorena]|nr:MULTISPECIES: hypothetical protein [unclassified Moorena]